MRYIRKFDDFLGQFKPLQDLSLLGLRLLLAVGFFFPGIQKWTHISETAGFFQGIGLPYPLFQVYLVATVEVLGAALLAFGLLTRIASIPLMVTMVVAAITVHWQHGWGVSADGIEFVTYYFAMLFVLLAFGAGRLSLDHYLRTRR